MEYDFRRIEKEWQKKWRKKNAYKISNPVPGEKSPKPKYYVLDMFPYPSGAGLHVGHPLGYIASDIYSRYKRLKGFNVLHPMGFDSFGLPAEQYALDTGQHPAETTKKNIATFKAQLDNIGFCYDWDREVRTSDPRYYKWTQWIFLQLFHSFYNRNTNKAEPLADLIAAFERGGNEKYSIPNSQFSILNFSAKEWNGFDEKTKQDILMQYRLAYCGFGEVNWCEALGTVLANDEVVNGVSERGGYPVVKKKLRQWYLRITEYADRLLEGLDRIDFSEAMKEMQTNWIGKSSGAEIEFCLKTGFASPQPSPRGEGVMKPPESGNFFQTADTRSWQILKDYGRTNRKNPTEAEDIVWQRIRNNQLGVKVRRQHSVQGYIVDFALLEVKLVIEIDGAYHNEEEQKIYDKARTEYLKEFDLELIRFTNDEVINNTEKVISDIKARIEQQKKKLKTEIADVDQSPLLREEKGPGDEAPKLRVYTTRPDTIFGADFMVIAPEHELVEQITTAEQKTAVEEYIAYVKSRSERERMAEKKISGVFTGAYALNPFDGREIPIWISEYVLAGYGTGAIMAVPCGDERDFKFAKHFNIPVTNIIGKHFNGEEANATKEAVLENSGFLNGLVMKEAMEVAIKAMEEKGIGVRKVNYKMRDAAFSRQRYWGEPFPIVWESGMAYPLDESELPLVLPEASKYSPGPDGEGPLANIKDWYLIPDPSPPADKGGVGAANVPKYSVHTPVQYELARTMRKDYTEAENKLWDLLRNNKLGVKFRRQHPIEAYIVDFVSLQEKLIVEVDGKYHETEEQKKYDAERTKVLTAIGFDVIRYTNEEVLKNSFEVRDKIKAKLGDRIPSPLVERGQGVRETSTMPGYAGSSWYFLRYMDPHNDKAFCDRNVSDYWNQVDLYIGGTEHAVGHLLYSRLWTKALYDLGYIGFDEPFKKLMNQGMITGVSEFFYRYNPDGDSKSKYMSDVIPYSNISISDLLSNEKNTAAFMAKGEGEYYFSYDAIPIGEEKNFSALHVFIGYVDANRLDVDELIKKESKYAKACFVCKDGFFVKGHWYNNDKKKSVKQIFTTTSAGEKMSKSKLNAINPDDLVAKYGADTFRMYEMFLGPVEMSKPWDTKGIEGVHRFLKKLWRLFFDETKNKTYTTSPLGTEEKNAVQPVWNNEKPVGEELKVLHKTIKKIEEDTERFSFNTAVSTFMIAVNELTDLKCHKKEILEPVLILLAPYAPHIAEELWQRLGNNGSILDAAFPKFEAKYVIESSKEYPISINGKMRTTMDISLSATQDEVEKLVLENNVVQKWMEGKLAKKIIFVKGKMVNVVL